MGHRSRILTSSDPLKFSRLSTGSYMFAIYFIPMAAFDTNRKSID